MTLYNEEVENVKELLKLSHDDEDFSYALGYWNGLNWNGLTATKLEFAHENWRLNPNFVLGYNDGIGTKILLLEK